MDQTARENGIRLIAPDRPGYGRSQPAPKVNLLQYLDDITQLADSLEIDKFAAFGVSGGGPYALACAYKLAHRLTVTAVMSGIGPLRLPKSTADMLTMNKLMFNLGRISPGFVGLILPRLIKSSLPSMEKHVQAGTSPSTDISPEFFAIMASDQRQAIENGGKGITFDMKILWQPWGFDLQDIRADVYLWHGDADNLAPAALAHYTADQIPGCQATFYPGEGHTDPLTKHFDEIMAEISRLISDTNDQPLG